MFVLVKLPERRLGQQRAYGGPGIGVQKPHQPMFRPKRFLARLDGPHEGRATCLHRLFHDRRHVHEEIRSIVGLVQKISNVG
jgi:hypothetical protein